MQTDAIIRLSETPSEIYQHLTDIEKCFVDTCKAFVAEVYETNVKPENVGCGAPC